MQMIGENHNRIDDKWAFSAIRAQRIAKKIDAIRKDFGTSVSKRDGEEIRATGNEVAPIIDHIELALPASRMSLRSCGLRRGRTENPHRSLDAAQRVFAEVVELDIEMPRGGVGDQERPADHHHRRHEAQHGPHGGPV